MAGAASTQTTHPKIWPDVTRTAPDAAIEQRVEAILARMSIEQKVGQTMQGDISSVTPEDVATYHLGSVLNGGSSAPGGDKFGPASNWVAAADAYYDASMRPQGNLPRIPVMWGSDAVHGHNNIVGATLFPHNIGLGAMNDSALIRRIGAATAIEMRVTGLDWTFAPTLAVVRDDRWGRTYEGFSEDPKIVADYAGAYVEGLQGKRGAEDWLRGPHVVATAKHFIADGGTEGGRDRGDAKASEAELIRLYVPPYVAALNAGVQAVMASFSSWNGAKNHGNPALLTDVLKTRWGFDGFVVGDWDGHAKVPTCTATDCAAALEAGLDMYMAPTSWKDLYRATLAEARSGTLPMARLDDAVRRILRVKVRAGLFEEGRPSSRPYAGQYALLGSPDHRALARQAVRESLVLLKNIGVLPLKPSARILVAGDGANSVAKQSGGWTITWQGTGTLPKHFPHAQTIWGGIDDAVKAGGGSAELSEAGTFATKPDVAIVVFGEDPYAEFQGDRPDLVFDDPHDNLAIMRRLKAAGVPVVAVFLSGRPLWVNPQLNAADAFVAAWLPGSEGGGVADMLFGGTPFRGRLSFSWPRTAVGMPLNVGDAKYKPLFPYGYGLTGRKAKRWTNLSEDSGVAPTPPIGELFAGGRAIAQRALQIDGANDSPLTITGGGDNGSIAVTAVDRDRQEDARDVRWSGKASGTLLIANPRPANLSALGPLAISITLNVQSAPTDAAAFEMGCGANCTGRFDATRLLKAQAGNGWQTLVVPVACFPGADLTRISRPLAITSSGEMRLTLSSVELIRAPTGQGCP